MRPPFLASAASLSRAACCLQGGFPGREDWLWRLQVSTRVCLKSEEVALERPVLSLSGTRPPVLCHGSRLLCHAARGACRHQVASGAHAELAWRRLPAWTRAAGSGHCRAAGETPAPVASAPPCAPAWTPRPVGAPGAQLLVQWTAHPGLCLPLSVWDLLSGDLLLEPKSVDGARSRLPWPVGGGGGEVSPLSSVTWGRGRGSLTPALPAVWLCWQLGQWLPLQVLLFPGKPHLLI